MQIYIDDIIVKSSSEDNHLNHLRRSIERMRLYGLKMNPLKCVFVQVIFLGFVVHKKETEINHNKAKAILGTKALSTKKELHLCWGKSTFSRDFYQI